MRYAEKGALMRLEYLLLGVLGVRPATGYELKKFFDDHGRFLRSNTQMSQVYRALAKMADGHFGATGSSGMADPQCC